MSDSSDSDCNSIINRCGSKKKRKIVMKVQFEDSDETSSGSSDDDNFKPSSSNQSSRGRKRLISSDEHDSVEASEIFRKVVICGKNRKDAIISDDIENADVPSTSKTAMEAEFTSDSSSDEALEKCPICLLSFRTQEIGTPETCDHLFCAICIEEWSKNVTTCPIDRREFNTIIVSESFGNRKVTRKIQVQDTKNPTESHDVVDLTYCEICRQADREEILLLCDGCNHGFHMVCLTPPLNEIPEGSWYCDDCFDSDDGEDESQDFNFLYEDLREMGVPETRLRIREVHQPRITRTRQSERIRASIVARTRTSSTRRPREENIVAASSSIVRRKAKTNRKSVKRGRKKKKNSRTFVVEYDVNNFDEKFASKKTKKYVKRIVRKSRRRRTRKACKSSTTSGLNNNFQSSFSVFGGANDLEYFSDQSETGDYIGEDNSAGGTAVQTSVRFRNIGSIRRRKDILLDLNRPTQQADVLSSIMELQDRWHSTARTGLSAVTIGIDGSLNFENNNNSQKKSESGKNTEKKADIPPEDINQVPLYPRNGNQSYVSGGSGENYSNRYNNQSNNNYRHSTGSSNTFGEYSPASNMRSFNNPFSQDNSNFHSGSNNFQRLSFPEITSNVRPRLRHPNDRFLRRSLNPNTLNDNMRPYEMNMPRPNFNLQSPNIVISPLQNLRPNITNFVDIRENQIALRRSSRENNIPVEITTVPAAANLDLEEIPLPTESPLDYATPEAASSNTPSLPIPPLAPPPWNKHLFELAGDSNDEDENDECPNFSVYSAESLQVARLSENAKTGAEKDGEKLKEDEFEEKEEDLVQLGDDDEIPDAIDTGKTETINNDSCEDDNSQKNDNENVNDMDMEIDEENVNDKEEDENNEDENENESTAEKNQNDSTNENIVNESSTNTSKIEENTNMENKDNADDDDSETTQEKKTNENDEAGPFNKKGVLELYDDSDWEEWNIEKGETPVKLDENKDEKKPEKSPKKRLSKDTNSGENPEKIQTESISEEEDRSYTPCLDEKTEHDDSLNRKNSENADTSENLDIAQNEEHDPTDISTTGIGGMETELISEEDEEILDQDQSRIAGRTSTRKQQDDKDKNIGNNKKSKKEQFKKISKNTKGRNYRDKDRTRRSRRRISRSRSNDKENQGGRRYRGNRRIRRREIERYDVRNVINQPRTYKDRYGRDTSRTARSRTRSRSRLRKIRSRSKSKSKSNSVSSKKIRRSFTISPSPVSFTKTSPRRRSFSPRRSRSRRRSRSLRRSPMYKRRSRTPLRMRSRSNSLTRRNLRKPRYRRRSMSMSSRSPSKNVSPKKIRSSSISHEKKQKKRTSKDRRKRKNKRKASTPRSSPHRQRRDQRSPEALMLDGGRRKRKNISKSKSPWSCSPPNAATVPMESSWTPPLISPNGENLTVILKNKEISAAAKRKRDKKKKSEKRREQALRKEKRKQRTEVQESTLIPSKEVFASGDNILVSVSFNKEGNPHLPQQTTVVTLPPTREEIISKRRSPEKKRQKKGKERQRRHKKTDVKPVAIIDLERSPFQVIAQSPRDIIVLTDSDREETNGETINNRKNSTEINPSQSETNNLQMENMHDDDDEDDNDARSDNIQKETYEMQQLGPKTPPEPPTVKFSLPAKNKQIKARNPLHDEQEEADQLTQEEAEMENSGANKIGPNTPPESGPCSPDAYDPFDPTKSPSVSRSPTATADLGTKIPENEPHTPEGNIEMRDVRTTTANTEKNIVNPVELVMALMSNKSNLNQDICNISSESAYNVTNSVEVCDNHEKNDENNIPKAISVLSNVLITPGKSQQRTQANLTVASPIAKTSQAIGTTPKSIISKLPLPKPLGINRHNGGASNDDNINEIESPYSPGSDDYEDLFEPPMDTVGASRLRKSKNWNNKVEMFDNLFGSTSPVMRRKRAANKHRKTAVKVSKLSSGKLDDDQIKIFDDLPSSAVELQVKDKFLRKLNRQERVVEEVKLVLKPHYNRKHISKDDYKDILRRSVPKICHSRSGEINPKKIQNLIEAYVRKFRQRNKLGIMGTGQVSSAVKCAAYLKKL